MFGIDDAIIGAGISGLGNVLGGVLGSPEKVSAGDNLQDLIDTARRNGISPLAVVGSNLQAGWGPANPIGDAVGHAANALGQSIANRGADDLQKRLIESQIAQSNASAADLLSSAQSRTLLSHARAASTGGPLGGGPTVLPNFVGGAQGIPIPKGKGVSDYNTDINNYGILPAELSGWSRLAHDLIYSGAIPWYMAQYNQGQWPDWLKGYFGESTGYQGPGGVP